jgi:hypothetical protein
MKVDLGPVIERIQALKAEGFTPVLERLDAMKADGFAAVLHQLDALQATTAGVVRQADVLQATTAGVVRKVDLVPLIQSIDAHRQCDIEMFHSVSQLVDNLAPTPNVGQVQERRVTFGQAQGNVQNNDQAQGNAQNKDLKLLMLKMEGLKSKIDFTPVLQRIDTMNRSLGSLSQVVNKVDASVQMSILAQGGADMRPVLEALEKIKGLDADLGPVIKRIDTIVSTLN